MKRNASILPALVGVVLMVVMTVAMWWLRTRPRPPVRPPAGPAPTLPPIAKVPPLVHTLATKNGLLSLRYPDGFDALSPDEWTILVQTQTVTVTVGGVLDPMTTDARELGETYLRAFEAKWAGTELRAVGKQWRPARCLSRFDGVEMTETVTAPGDPDGHLTGCFFFADRLFGLTLTLAYADDPRARTLADAILATVERHPPAEPDPAAPEVVSDMPNRLLVAHHPPFWVATPLGDSALALDAPDRTSITLYAMPLAPGVTAAASEKSFWDALVPLAPMTYREEHRGPGRCMGAHTGTRASGTMYTGEHPTFGVRACVFTAKGRSYGATISFPVAEAEKEKRLWAIVDGTEIAP